MYEDIYSLTDKMFSVAKKNKQKSVYDVYRNIRNYNVTLRLKLVYCFDTSLDEDFLTQTTSFGSGLEEWVYFTNRDFGELTRATKKLLRSLIPAEELNLGRSKNIFRIENGKVYSGIVDDYVSGVVKGDGMFLTQSVISLSKKNNFSSKELELDISSFDKRAALIEKTNDTLKEMENLQREFRAYILSDSAVEDLL